MKAPKKSQMETPKKSQTETEAPTTPPTNVPTMFRIISMDGGDGRVTAQLLEEISTRLKQKYPQTEGNFLGSVILFTGTSAGGINSLLLAQQEDVDSFVQSELLPMWQQLELAMLPLPPKPPTPPAPNTALQTFGPLGALIYPFQLAQYLVPYLAQLGLALVGLHNFVGNEQVKSILLQQFGAQKLGDLRKIVAITSLQLDNNEVGEGRHWTPKVYTNVPLSIDPQNQDLEELCVDVALRTSAQPIYFPIYQASDEQGPGYIDGGYVANSPGMVAIGRAYQVIHTITTTPEGGPPLGSGLEAVRRLSKETTYSPAEAQQGRVLMLSLGAGTQNMFPGPDYIGPEQLKFFGGSATWGYLLWLLNPTQPFVLLNALLGAQAEEIDFQLQNVLFNTSGIPNYYRFGPDLKHSREVPSEGLKQFVRDSVADDDFDAVVEWLVKSGWVAPDQATA